MNYKSTEKASLSSRTGWQTFQQDMKSNYMKNNNTTTKSQPILTDGLAKLCKKTYQTSTWLQMMQMGWYSNWKKTVRKWFTRLRSQANPMEKTSIKLYIWFCFSSFLSSGFMPHITVQYPGKSESGLPMLDRTLRAMQEPCYLASRRVLQMQSSQDIIILASPRFILLCVHDNNYLKP